MNNNKKNIIIIILIIIVIALSGFIIYDKMIDKDNDNNNDISSNNQVLIENSEDVLLYGDIFYEILNEEQQRIVNLDKNFKDVTYTINNIPVTYNCTSYEESEPSRCVESTVKINNHTIIIDNWSLGCGQGYEIIYTKNYLIKKRTFACTETGNIEIYDNNHNLLLNIDNVSDSYQDETGKYIYDGFKLQDNKLYFASYDKNVYDYGLLKKTYYSYIDLKDNTYKIHNIIENNF